MDREWGDEGKALRDREGGREGGRPRESGRGGREDTVHGRGSRGDVHLCGCSVMCRGRRESSFCL